MPKHSVTLKSSLGFNNLDEVASFYVNEIIATGVFNKVLPERSSLKKLIQEEAFEILQPTFSIQSEVKNQFGSRTNISLDSDHFLHDLFTLRMKLITQFIAASLAALESYLISKKSFIPNTVSFTALSGDSHHGGKRPIAFNIGSKYIVLKHADPRPYLLSSSILHQLYTDIGIKASEPDLWASPDNQWYFIDYLDSDDNSHLDIESHMFSMGVIAAFTCALSFIDLHLENIISYKGNNIIIDPECIFYNFQQSSPDDHEDRLLRTGILSENANFSAMRGGAADEPISELSSEIDRDGVYQYIKPFTNFRNVVKEQDGSICDPGHYQDIVLNGYSESYQWLLLNKNNITDIINKYVTDGFRIRFLARKTRHYSSVIKMLYLPRQEQYSLWANTVLDRFASSGGFLPQMQDVLIQAELMDIKQFDTPYFWVDATEKAAIYHRSGKIHDLNTQVTVKEQAIKDIWAINKSDLNNHLEIVRGFLNIDLKAQFAAERNQSIKDGNMT